MCFHFGPKSLQTLVLLCVSYTNLTFTVQAILEVPFVRTHDNLADLLTKPMKNSTRFRELRNAIMNIRED